MRLPRFSTFPRLKMVDRRGYAPRTAGCKPADFLTNLAAHEWHGVSVLPRARGVLETLLRKLAPAVFLKIGAISRNCTGIP
jgi:hypothetical protein